MSNTNINIIDCGIKDYQSVLNLQENAFQNLLAGTGNDAIFIVEHPPVITLGARNTANKLSKDAEAIKQAGVEIFQIRRGGGTTAHNPGQLIVYPIINLKKRSLGVSDFVHLLEKIGVEFLAELGLACSTKKGFPGLWIEDNKKPRITQITQMKTEPRINTNIHKFKIKFLNSVNPCLPCEMPLRLSHRGKSVSEKSSVNQCPLNPRNLSAKALTTADPWLKIASIGVQVKKWITIHGIAININNDLSIFDLIVPCGLENVKMTSAQIELGRTINIDDAKNILKKILLKHFIG